jgi:hypothetical protein
MLPHHDDLIGDWTGLIVHQQGAARIEVCIKEIQEDGTLYGSYSIPKSHPPEPGGEFIGELFEPWLFIKLKDNPKVRFQVQILGENCPELIYGAIPRANGKSPHATITMFRSGQQPIESPILGLWQIFLREGL